MDLELAQLPPLERYKLPIGLVIPASDRLGLHVERKRRRQLRAVLLLQRDLRRPAALHISFNWCSDGTIKHTLKNIRRTEEFVVNLADEGTAKAMHLTGTEIPEAESEFAKFGLTPVPATLVKHPRIA